MFTIMKNAWPTVGDHGPKIIKSWKQVAFFIVAAKILGSLCQTVTCHRESSVDK